MQEEMNEKNEGIEKKESKEKEQKEKKPTLPEINIGEIVGGKYRIRKKIASGGMADVYEAEQVTLRRKVALKVLKGDMTLDEDARTMFYKEAQMVAQELDHPNIVKVYDFGEHKGRFYIVMYYVNGVTLDTYIREKGKLSVPEALKIAVEVLKALEYAHKKGIIHRDIKPSNVMLSTDGRVYLLDFGIADIVMGSGKKGTRVPGTPEYMAPEQFRGRWDHRSDIYSVGIILYEMLTGKTPFYLDEKDLAYIRRKSKDRKQEKNESIWVLQRKVFSGEAIPPSRLNPEVPPEVDSIVLKAIDKVPSERFQSASEFIKAILDTGIITDDDYRVEDVDIPEGGYGTRGGVVSEEEVAGTKITQFIPIDEEEEEAEFFFEEVEASSGGLKKVVIFGLLLLAIIALIAGVLVWLL